MKEKLIWKSANDPISKDLSFIWVTDHENIWLTTRKGYYEMFDYRQYSWAKSEIEYPDIPERPIHECKIGSFSCFEIRCDNERKLMFECSCEKESFCEVFVCPFCGIKADDL